MPAGLGQRDGGGRRHDRTGLPSELLGRHTSPVIPDTRYARTSDGTYVAYQVAGTGPVDVVFAPGWFSNIELAWEHPEIGAFLQRLSGDSRLILFDRRGTGLSDPIAEASTLDSMM